jgi:hypothetical protein
VTQWERIASMQMSTKPRVTTGAEMEKKKIEEKMFNVISH